MALSDICGSRLARISFYLCVAFGSLLRGVQLLSGTPPSPFPPFPRPSSTQTFESSVAWAKENAPQLYRWNRTPGDAHYINLQVARLDIERATQLFAQTVHNKKRDSGRPTAALNPVVIARLETMDPAEREGWNAVGLQMIAKGSASVLTMAGGQGTRLGFEGPKGAFDIGLPSNSSLFQIYAERILRLQDLATIAGLKAKASLQPGGVKLLWLVMTSPPTDAGTRDFFSSNAYFGLEPTQVVFFVQTTLPAFSPEGEILLSAHDTIAESPDGNGAIYAAMAAAGVLEILEARGVKYTHVHAVDNALSMVSDPLLLGYAAATDAEIVNKVVARTNPLEKTGVPAMRGRDYVVVEYSELGGGGSGDVEAGPTFSSADPADYPANICSHLFSVEFLKRASVSNIPYHIARKTIAQVDQTTGVVAKAPGIKLERFIFDAFVLAKKVVTLEVPRHLEFAPVKNAHGADSPATARSLVSAAAKHMFARARAKSAPAASAGDGGGDHGSTRAAVAAAAAAAAAVAAADLAEISPLLTYRDEGLAASEGDRVFFKPGPRILLRPALGFGYRPFKLDLLAVVNDGIPGTAGFKIRYKYRAAKTTFANPIDISPWHNIPLIAGVDDAGDPLFHFVCEIPKGSRNKYEIHKTFPFNPIVQDVKCKASSSEGSNEEKCKLRTYNYPQDSPASPVNYGALPQTWEDPHQIQRDTGEGGDNDPIDVLELDPQPCTPGQVKVVRLLGAFAMIDHSGGGESGETDWKLLVVPANTKETSLNDAAAGYRSLRDVPADQIEYLHEWFQNYKLPDGKPKNAFAFDGKPVGKERALEAVVETHLSWAVWRGGRSHCEYDTPLADLDVSAGVNPCWKRGLFDTQRLQ